MNRLSAKDLLARRLRIRRRLRMAKTALLVFVAALLGWRALRPASDDQSLFDGRSFAVARAIDGDSFILADDRETPVTLLGVDAPEPPDGHFATEASAYLAGRLKDARVLLKLEGTQTRDERGRLRAYVYLLDTNLLNVDIVRDGRAYADRRTWYAFAPGLAAEENEARTRKRGLWADLTDAQMPAWRRDWLRSLDRTRK